MSNNDNNSWIEFSKHLQLQDAVAQLLEHKEENPRVIPARFLSD